MMKVPRIPSDELRECALRQMEEAGMPLERLPSKSRAMLYKMENGETVRIRTTNDPILIVVADTPTPEANLNIDGTDHLLIVMPEAPRTPGPVKSYLVPTKVAVSAVRKAHQEWLDSNPTTKGDNRTWNIWFGDTGRPGGNFGEVWKEYLLPATASTEGPSRAGHGSQHSYGREKQEAPPSRSTQKTVADVIDKATQEISELTGVPRDSIQIEVKMGG